MAQWGVAGFDSGWVDAPNDIDSVAPSKGATEVELEPPHGVVTGAGAKKDHRIGTGQAGRGLVNTTENRYQANPINDGYYYLSLNPTMDPLSTCAAVHDVPANTSALKFKFLLRCELDHENSPSFESPDKWQKGSTYEPNEGSDRVVISLDLTQDWTKNFSEGSSSVDYENSRPGTTFELCNHFLGFPWRVRMDRDQAPAGNKAGPTGIPGTDFDPIAECRLWKVTTSTGILQYQLHLVWWGNSVVSSSNKVFGLTDLDFILLAAYDPIGGTPSFLTSPFFHVDPTIGTYAIYNTVEVEVTVSLNGLVSMKCTTVGGPKDGYSEVVSIDGQAMVTDGGFDGSGNPVGLSKVDIGCWHATRPQWSDVSPILANYFSNEIGYHQLSWSMDELEGDDVAGGESPTGNVVYADDFSTGLHSSGAQGMQTCSLEAYPRAGREIVWVEEGAAQGNALNWQASSSLRNFKSVQAEGEDLVAIVPGGSGKTIDLDGSIGSDPWFSPNNNSFRIHVQEGSSPTQVSVYMDFQNSPRDWQKHPNEQAPDAVQLGPFGLGLAGEADNQTAKIRFSNATAPGSGAAEFDFPAPDGDQAALNYCISVPLLLTQWNTLALAQAPNPAGDGGRAHQIEVCLFTDALVETSAGASPGLGDPPKGVGVLVRNTSLSGGATRIYTYEFFIEGTPSSDVRHPIVGLTSIIDSISNDLVVQASDPGDGSVYFSVWLNGRRWFTNAGGTADVSILKSELNGFKHGIGMNVCGFSRQALGVANPLMINSFTGLRGIRISADTYQKRFHLNIDKTKLGFDDLTLFVDQATSAVDFVAPPESGHTPHQWLNSGRVRCFQENFNKHKHTALHVFSIIDDGGTTSVPFPGVTEPVDWEMSADFPCATDDVLETSALTDGLLAYRGFTIRSIPNQWVDLDPPTSGHPDYGAGPAPGMYIPGGVSLVLWGNPTDRGGLIDLASKIISVKLYAVNDSGAVVATSAAVNLYVPANINVIPPPNATYYRCRLTETTDNQTGTRTYSAEVFAWNGTSFSTTPVATPSLSLSSAQFANFNGSQASVMRYLRYQSQGAFARFSTTWMTRVSVGTTVPAVELRYDARASAANVDVASEITGVRGIMNVCPFATITNVRGLMSGVVHEGDARPLRRRLLVFEKSKKGLVPGSKQWLDSGFPANSLDGGKNYFYAGAFDPLSGSVWYGNPDFNFDEQSLLDHQIAPVQLATSPTGSPTLTLRQDSVSWSGGHLRVGQLVVYIHEVTGIPGHINPFNGLIYGGTGIKVLFRGLITRVDRDSKTNSVIYTAVGPKGELENVDIQQLSNCEVGKIAFNVDAGSINTPFAVSQNVTYGAGALPNSDTPDSMGSILGPGTPNLVGMTLGEIISWLINNFRYELNALGLLRIKPDGELVEKDEDTADTFPGFNGSNVSAADSASVVWRPNKASFNVQPPEIVVKGRFGHMLNALVKLMPDVRWRIEPGTLRWVFEKRKALTPISFDGDLPGVDVALQDDASACITRVIYTSPWQKQEKFEAKLSNGTLVPNWDQGNEDDWMGPFKQIGSFDAVVTGAQNWPYGPGIPDPDNQGGDLPPQSTVIDAKVTVDDEFPVPTFNGATVVVTSGQHAGQKRTVVNSYKGGYDAVTKEQHFTMTVEPALPGGWGFDVQLAIGDTITVTDDPTEGTTESTSAWSSIWSDFIVIESVTTKPVANLIQSGASSFNLQLPTSNIGLPYGSGSINQNIASQGNVNYGFGSASGVTSGLNLATPGNSCSLNGVQVGEIIYNAIRKMEGTWCAQAPEGDNYAGTAYSDIDQYEGTIHQVHQDGLGFVDLFANWANGRWAPRQGAFATILLIGGEKVTFDFANYTPSSFPQNDLNQGVDEAFQGGWEVSHTDADQSLKPVEERSPDASDDIAEWHKLGSGSAWDTATGIAFKTSGGTFGQTRGSILTRFIPPNYAGPQKYTSPDLLAGATFSNTSINNNGEIEVQLQLDTTHSVTSLCQVGIILRAENGFVIQRRVPQDDVVPASGPKTPLFSEDDVSDELGPGLSSVRGLSAEAAFNGATGIAATNKKAVQWDVIPDWVSSDASKKNFKATSTPNIAPGQPGESDYDLKKVLCEDGVVLNSRIFNGHVSEKLTDKVTNGGFGSGIAPWAPDTSGAGPAASITILVGQMRMTHDASSGTLLASQSIGLSSGKRYRVRAEISTAFATFPNTTAEISIDSTTPKSGGDEFVVTQTGITLGQTSVIEGFFTASSTGTFHLAIVWKNDGHPQAQVDWDNVSVEQIDSGISDISSTYDTGSASFPSAKAVRKKGLEFGSTGYVFRYVRDDEPDMLLGVPATGNVAYPTLFWYHVRRAVDSSTGQQALDSNGHPVYEGVKEILWQGGAGVDAAALGGGGNLVMRLSTQMALPFGKKNHLKFQLTGLGDPSGGLPGGGQFYGVKTHDPRAVKLRQMETAAGGTLSGGNGDDTSLIEDLEVTLTSEFDIFGLSGFDGVYSGYFEGFSFARGAGGFGLGCVKAAMTYPDQTGPNVGLYTVVKPAKIVRFKTRSINTPKWDVGGQLGISPTDLAALTSLQYDQATAVRVLSNDKKSLRFDGQELGFSPSPGDKYRIVFERGWNITRTRVFEAPGLDDPSKVWIFKHLTDSALTEFKDKRYQGTISIPGVAHELVQGGFAVNLLSLNQFTGLEAVNQLPGSVTVQLEGELRTTVTLNGDGRSEYFAAVEELFREALEDEALDTKPYFLGPDALLAGGKGSQAAGSGVNPGATLGTDSVGGGICAESVFASQFTNVTNNFVTLNQLLNLINQWLVNIKVLIGANKEGLGGGSFVRAVTGGLDFGAGGGGGLNLTAAGRDDQDKLLDPLEWFAAKEKLKHGREPTGQLVDDSQAYYDKSQDLYFSPVLRKNSNTGAYSAAWAHVVPDPDRRGRWKLGDKAFEVFPRESGTYVDSDTIDGTLSTYTFSAGIPNPFVQIRAGTNYVGPAGVLGTAVDGVILDAGNTGGFVIKVHDDDPTTVSVQASSAFGPCHIYVTS